MDTKSGDKKTTLMHFLVQTVQDKFPEMMNFDSELRFLDKAALGIISFVSLFSLFFPLSFYLLKCMVGERVVCTHKLVRERDDMYQNLADTFSFPGPIWNSFLFKPCLCLNPQNPSL